MSEFLTINEIAQMLKLSKRTICNLMLDNNNPIPALRIGRSVRFRKDAVNEWLKTLGEKKAG